MADDSSALLALKVEFEIKELPATELVSREIYDDSGNITGMRPEEEYQAMMKDYEGRVFFAIRTVVGDKHTLIRSEVSAGGPMERDERAFILSQGLQQLGVSIYKNFSK